MLGKSYSLDRGLLWNYDVDTSQDAFSIETLEIHRIHKIGKRQLDG